MTLLAYLLFALCVAALLHTYVLYPLLVRLAASALPGNTLQFASDDTDLPRVTVLMSLHNEEKVIAEKMHALQALQYPAALLRFYIGSDASSDQTNAIVADFAQKDPRIEFFPFAIRRGKPPVINELAARALTEYPRRRRTHIPAYRRQRNARTRRPLAIDQAFQKPANRRCGRPHARDRTSPGGHQPKRSAIPERRGVAQTC